MDRIAVISDIHGNCFALDAVLADLRKLKAARTVCLGDAIQGGAQPHETVERLRESKCPVVMGNADAWLLNDVEDSAEPTTEQQRDVRAWTLSELTEEDLGFMGGFKPTIELDLNGGNRLLCFHGSPKSFDEILLPETPEEIWDRALRSFSPAIMAGGHTHTQQVRRVGYGLFFNPGSVGFAYDIHRPKEKFRAEHWAEYAILSEDDRKRSLEFRRVDYDLEASLSIIRKSGRPHIETMIADYQRT